MSESQFIALLANDPGEPGLGMAALGVFGKFSQAISWAVESIRERGVATTCKIVVNTVEDSFFDWRYGTETYRAVDCDQFESSLANRAHAVRYKATKARPFLALLRHLRLPEGSTFVDVGSGKGRVLLLAARQNFKRVIGIEFSPTFCEQARKNIEIFRTKVQPLAPIEVTQADITQHEWRGDENVFFLYNPFDAVILGQFVENVRRSVGAHPRQIWLIYSAPLYASILGESGLFPHQEAISFWGTDFHIYTNGPQAKLGTRQEAAP
jgi:SAM-dependent methyltransferase